MTRKAERADIVACPECAGDGWTVGVDYETQCCGGSDWECGARGCTGPVQEQVQFQEQCERCFGTGSIERADHQKGSGNG